MQGIDLLVHRARSAEPSREAPLSRKGKAGKKGRIGFGTGKAFYPKDHKLAPGPFAFGSGRSCKAVRVDGRHA